MATLYESVKCILETPRSNVYRAINAAMVDAYSIVDEEQRGERRAEYGASLLKYLAQRLTDDFGKGSDESNLRYMRLFYNAFPIRGAVRHELSWTHYRLLSKVTNEKARTWYMHEAASQYTLFLPTEAELTAELAREKFMIEQARQIL